MKDRIKQIRKRLPEHGKTQEIFAKYLGISKQNLASYETGRRIPSDAVIQLICQKCNVREEWLRNGIGEISEYTDTDDYSEISTLIGENDPKAKQAIIDYWKLSDNDKELFWEFVDRFLIRDNRQKENLARQEDPFGDVPDTPEELEAKYPPVEKHIKDIG